MTQKILEQVDYIVVHCAATPARMDIGAEEIDRWHRERGFLKIGYHAVVRRNGRIEWGRKDNEIGAHAYGFNNKSIGVCLVGGMDKDNKRPENNFTEAQFDALRYLILYYKNQWPDAAIIGHGDLKGVNKACPSFDVQQWWQEHAAH